MNVDRGRRERRSAAPGDRFAPEEVAHDDHAPRRPRRGLGLAVLPPGPSWPVRAAAPVRSSPRSRTVYRFRNNFHYSVVVRPTGVIATDPINADAAKWLKAEIAQRFQQPVRYLVYSHDHADHISGGEVFADTATVVGHQNARATIIGEKRPTAVPQVTFSDRMVIELGGTVAELTYVGKNHSDNSLVLRFPRERILFAVDFIPGSRSFRDWRTHRGLDRVAPARGGDGFRRARPRPRPGGDEG
jgi:glyoxylase-like metal-dependent hydrolase (beta-lactamase superfamily II)